MPNLKQRAREDFEEAVLNSGRAWKVSEIADWWLSKQDQAVAEEREKLINLVKLIPIETYVAYSKKDIGTNRAFDTGKAYMKDQIIKTLTTHN